MHQRNKNAAGFTLIEAVVSVALFAAGTVYIYGTFAGVTKSSTTATIEMDLNGEAKRAITKLYGELQATSLRDQDLNDDGFEVPVFTITEDEDAPPPKTLPKTVNREGQDGADADGANKWKIGGGMQQAREMTITRSKRISFRKVVGYAYNAGGGSIVPEWSGEVTYFVTEDRQLVREVGDRRKVVANHVDAFEVIERGDASLLVIIVTARQGRDGSGWRRHANAVVVHPKN